MSLVSRLHRIVTVCLLSMIVFFGMSFNVDDASMAMADSITRDMTNLPLDAPVAEEAYEEMKIGRQQKQAMRSEKAEETAEQKLENETLTEKLNLDEISDRLSE